MSVKGGVTKNYYLILGVLPNATQADIKSAYYKLSKIYHPDKNQGSKFAAEKFQLITAAYEVLGNHDNRRRYDKGFLSGMNDDDDSTAQEAMTKKTYTANDRSTPSVRIPIYNYDEWSRAHYGQAFARRSAAKNEYDINENINVNVKRDNAIFTILLVFIILLFFSTIFTNDKIDRITNKKNESMLLSEDKFQKK